MSSDNAYLGSLPAIGYVRQSQLISNKKHPERPAPIPFSAPTLWRKVNRGEFPRPVKLSAGVTAWRVEDIRAWMDKQGGQK